MDPDCPLSGAGFRSGPGGHDLGRHLRECARCSALWSAGIATPIVTAARPHDARRAARRLGGGNAGAGVVAALAAVLVAPLLVLPLISWRLLPLPHRPAIWNHRQVSAQVLSSLVAHNVPSPVTAPAGPDATQVHEVVPTVPVPQLEPILGRPLVGSSGDVQPRGDALPAPDPLPVQGKPRPIIVPIQPWPGPSPTIMPVSGDPSISPVSWSGSGTWAGSGTTGAPGDGSVSPAPDGTGTSIAGSASAVSDTAPADQDPAQSS